MRKWTLALAFLLPFSVLAGDQELRRILIGTRVFGATLAAVEAPQEAASGQPLRVAVVYRDDPGGADAVVARLRAFDLGGAPLRVRAVHADALPATGDVAAVFVAEWLPSLADLLAWAQLRHVLVFSPFLGDVERGAHAGLYVTDRILPLVNLPALRSVPIRLKPFFLEVARRHGD